MTTRLDQARENARDQRRRRFRRTTNPQDPHNRLVALFVVFVLISAALVAVLVDIQTVRDDHLRDYGESQRSRTRSLDGYRGEILDRNGFVFASSTPSLNVFADPTLIDDPQATAEILAPVLDTSPELLEVALQPENKDSQYVRLARSVGAETSDTIEQLQADEDAMVGIVLEPEEHRVYPTGEVARPIVGRVDPDENGVTGIEKQYDEIMDGQPGVEQFEGGRFGRISVGESVVDPATDGFDVILTLDHRLQFMAEQTLVAHCEETGAESLTAVISEPSSGEILTMASVDRSDDGVCEVAGYNRALVDTFEPGSVMKPMTIAGSVNSLGYDRTTPIEVPPKITIANKPFVDDPAHPAAMFPLSQILTDSMNVGTIKMAQELGDDALYGYFNSFGLGKSTGLGFQGESVGTLRKPGDWQGSDSGSIPIGQGVTVNATQIVAAYNVFANGGTYQQPLLIASLRNSEGESFTPDPRPTHTVISPEAAAEMRAMLLGVVEEGTGQRAVIPGYTVGGKTGTAWKVFEGDDGKLSYGEPGNRRYVVTFAGLVPANDPQISMAVVVNEPRDVFAPTAGAVAAPIFAEIGQDALRILSIRPDVPAEASPDLVRGEPAQLPVPVPKATPAPAPAPVALKEVDDAADPPNQGGADDEEPVTTAAPTSPSEEVTRDDG